MAIQSKPYIMVAFIPQIMDCLLKARVMIEIYGGHGTILHGFAENDGSVGSIGFYMIKCDGT
ncbi:hypothetical protein D3C75_1287060 [compost metagenome]